MVKSLLVAALLPLIPSPAIGQVTSRAVAQDCGLECATCAGVLYRKEGVTHDPDGPYDMDCKYVGKNNPCNSCPETSIAEDWISAQEIAEIVRLADVSELPELVLAYGDRLTILADRKAIGVIGTACSPTLVDRLVFVAPGKLTALEDLTAARVLTADSKP